MTKSVLIISYFFPPVGGAGVQRVSKFVKYLPNSDWQPIVLTTSNPSVPLFDESLLEDIPDSAIVYKARTLEPSYAAKQSVSASSEVANSGIRPVSLIKSLIRKLAISLLQPDPQVLWLPSAYWKAKQVIETHRPDAIFATAPPFSSLLLGARLANKYGIPLIIDFRDEWDISNSVWENKKIGPISLAVQRRMQNYAIRAASAVLATTQMSVESLDRKIEDLQSSAISQCVYNGFDKDDCKPGDSVKVSEEHYVLSYVGTLWNLTSIEPLVKAVGRLSKEEPELTAKLKIVLAGRKTEEQKHILASLEQATSLLELHDYMDHDEAISLMFQSRGLILLLSDYDFAKRVVPGKVFEYFATGNTIFAIAPEGEVWNLIEDYSNAYVTSPGDIEQIKNALKVELQEFVKGNRRVCHDFDASRYERSELTQQLTAVLEKVTA